jgi:hypothetical protein
MAWIESQTDVENSKKDTQYDNIKKILSIHTKDRYAYTPIDESTHAVGSVTSQKAS